VKLTERGKLPGRKVAGPWRFAKPDVHHWFENRIGLSDEAALLEVEAVLQTLAARELGPLVTKLPRQTGFKESRFAHRLAGEVTLEPAETAPRLEPATVAVRLENERLAKLEADTEALRREFAELKQQFANFRKQFE